MRLSIPLPNPPGDPEPRRWWHLVAQYLGTAYQCLWEYPSQPLSVSGVEAIALGTALYDEGWLVVARSLRERFPDTAELLIGEWERRLGLPINPSAPLADRQAACITKIQCTSDISSLGILIKMQEIFPPVSIDTQGIYYLNWTASSLPSVDEAARMRSLLRAALPAYTTTNL